MPRTSPIVIGVIEDDLAVATKLGTLLSEEGYQTVHVQNVLASLAMVSLHAPAALLIDVMLHKGASDEFRAQLHDRVLDLPPLVLLASGTEEQIVAAQRASGAVAALPKPVDGDLLMGIIEEIVAHPHRATTLERTLATLIQRGHEPFSVRCPACRWLLYLGAPDYVSGIFAGHRYGHLVTCPGCGNDTPLPTN